MAQGIQVFNADGSLQFDTSNRLLRSLTSVTSGISDGSVTVAGATQGQVVGVAMSGQQDGVTPTVTSSGTTVSWSFQGAPLDERKSVAVGIMVF